MPGDPAWMAGMAGRPAETALAKIISLFRPGDDFAIFTFLGLNLFQKLTCGIVSNFKN